MAVIGAGTRSMPRRSTSGCGEAVSDAARAKPEQLEAWYGAYNRAPDLEAIIQLVEHEVAEQAVALRAAQEKQDDLIRDAVPLFRAWQTQSGDYQKTMAWLQRARALLAAFEAAPE